MKRERLQIIIQGQVQGVRLRPHIYHVAHQLNLTGWVKYTSLDVLIEVQGKLALKFLDVLKINLPPLVKITNIQKKEIDLKINEHLFEVLKDENIN